MAVRPSATRALLGTCGFRPDLDPNGNGYPVVPQNRSLNTTSKAFCCRANRMIFPSKKVKPFAMLLKHLVVDGRENASMERH